MQSTRDDETGSYKQIKLKKNNIDINLFNRISKEVAEMNPQPKRVLIQGLGEALINKQLPQMIRQLRNDGFMGRIDIVTNGSLFNKENVKEIIDAGISKIIISLQGMTAEAYKENCQYEIDFEEFVSNLTYLYENRKNAHVYIKIIDIMLKSEEERERFFDIFGNISDTCNIEHLIVNQSQMGDHGGRVDHRLILHNEPILERDICPMPFYLMQIFLDGTVLACPITGAVKQLEIGHLKEQTLMEIWNGKRRRNLLEAMLKKTRYGLSSCKECECLHNISDERENLDCSREEILKRMEAYYGIRN